MPTPTRNINLKVFILRRGWTQRGVAAALNIPEVDLSKIVNGRRPAPPEVRAGLARILNVPERELFPDPSTVAA